MSFCKQNQRTPTEDPSVGVLFVSRKPRHGGEDQKRLTDEKKKRTKKKTKKELVGTGVLDCPRKQRTNARFWSDGRT